jgi:hypothetical protein
MDDINYEKWFTDNNDFYEINWIDSNDKFLHFEPYFIAPKTTPLYHF